MSVAFEAVCSGVLNPAEHLSKLPFCDAFECAIFWFSLGGVWALSA